ncbi:putative esterase of the alpha-beta hydrolase superfamily [Candidatus Sulfobium mesophilum]|uniref:Putative esterase of the alpha-beta hydrolase superfamily n=1 Tax=Candidatus Sulfobium mesophilum TaxID=2016548 RepID=A0A2U3QKF0_9BACT|nr:putative esterase of the alpha-beta hydrolase superfamily [Candidatus Sulfobium mesophilum]
MTRKESIRENNINYSAVMTVVLTIFVMFLQGCATPARLPAVPQGLEDQAQVPGLADVRYRVGFEKDMAAMEKEGIEAYKRELENFKATGHSDQLPPAVFLAVSGGGDAGAFGAGLLCGWTAAGNRPEFKLVTGISTGALIGPFAFLGSSYDSQLKEFYTTISPKDIHEKRGPFAVITDDALASNQPLMKLVEKAVTKDMMDAIAAEYKKGRLFLVATVDLDAHQGIIWNMTKIAASSDPRAVDLFRRILIASASIPGAFPPMMIDVEVGGVKYQEMHVDGGTMAQVFLYPPSLNIKEWERKEKVGTRERKLYIIRNSRLDPEWAQVDRRTLSIIGQAISSLIQTQGIGDLYRIYLTAQKDGIDYNLSYIPASFKVPKKEEFDTEYMRQLFDTGYGMAVKGYPWQKKPPYYQPPTSSDSK